MLCGEKIKLKNGRSWEVYTGGAGPKLVWLHGLTGLMPNDPLLAALERKYSVIAPVAPGFNDLGEIDEIGNIHELALDYDDLLEHFAIEGAVLAGHSFGAMAAAEIAAHFPRRAKQLVLMAPVGLWNDAYPVTDVFAEPYMMIENLLWADNAAREALAATALERSRAAKRCRAHHRRGASADRGNEIHLADSGEGLEEAPAAHRRKDADPLRRERRLHLVALRR